MGREQRSKQTELDCYIVICRTVSYIGKDNAVELTRRWGELHHIQPFNGSSFSREALQLFPVGHPSLLKDKFMFPAQALGIDSVQCECSYKCTKEVIVTIKACVSPWGGRSPTLRSGCAPVHMRGGWNASLPCKCSADDQVLSCDVH